MFKKNEEDKRVEELSKSEFARADIEFSRTVIGKKMYIYSILPAILTAITAVYTISTELANGYIDIGNVGSILMLGLGITSITKILYFQNLSRYYNHKEKK